MAPKGTLHCKGWVKSRKHLGPYHLLELELDRPPGEIRWGQFALVEAPGCLLMRPMSLFSVAGQRVSFLFRSVGKGTRALASAPCGERLRVLLPLGQGFPPPAGGKVVLVAGGVGIAPLHPWALKLSRQGHAVTFFWGARDASWFPAALLMPLLEAGVEVKVCTEDGSLGPRAMVTGLLEAHASKGPGVAYICGPHEMARVAHQILTRRGLKSFVSVEERMACGVGACLGCGVETIGGRKLVCKDGPVFQGEELLWNPESR